MSAIATSARNAITLSTGSKLRGEWEIRRATADEAHALKDVEIEDASNEPA